MPQTGSTLKGWGKVKVEELSPRSWRLLSFRFLRELEPAARVQGLGIGSPKPSIIIPSGIERLLAYDFEASECFGLRSG